MKERGKGYEPASRSPQRVRSSSGGRGEERTSGQREEGREEEEGRDATNQDGTPPKRCFNGDEGLISPVLASDIFKIKFRKTSDSHFVLLSLSQLPSLPLPLRDLLLQSLLLILHRLLLDIVDLLRQLRKLFPDLRSHELLGLLRESVVLLLKLPEFVRLVLVVVDNVEIRILLRTIF